MVGGEGGLGEKMAGEILPTNLLTHFFVHATRNSASLNGIVGYMPLPLSLATQKIICRTLSSAPPPLLVTDPSIVSRVLLYGEASKQ